MTRVMISRIMVSWVITPMASIVIPGIMCAAIRRRGEGCVRTHCMHKRSRCNACAVEYISLDNEKKKKDDLHP